MKKQIVNISVIILIFILGLCVGLNLYNPCDVNRDGKVSAIDYVKVKNYIMREGD